MPAISCLIIDEMHPSIIPMLQETGIDVAYRPDIKIAEIRDKIGAYDGLVVRSKLFISEDILQHAPKLKFIARAGAGVDNIDEAAITARNITLLNAPEGNCDAVGEFTLGLLLALFRNIVKADQEVSEYAWLREANRGEEIMGKTIALIGYGHMGRAFAKRLTAFDCRVLAYDKNDGIKKDGNATLTNLSEIYEHADVVSFHIPYTPVNRYVGNEAFFSSFKKDIWLLNTARGEVLDQTAVVQLLKSGKIRGAALDVLENEKLAALTEQQKKIFEYLAQAPNVILTPHIGGWSHQSYVKINEVLVRKIKQFFGKD